MVGGDRQDQVFVEQRQLDQVAAADRRRGQHGVDVAGVQRGQQMLGQPLGEVQPQPREPLADRLQQQRRDVGSEGGDQAEPEGAGERLGAVLHDLIQPAALVEDDLRLRHDGGAALGDQDGPPGPLEDVEADVVFQFADLRAQGRLTDRTGGGGLAEMQVVGEGHDVFQVTEA